MKKYLRMESAAVLIGPLRVKEPSKIAADNIFIIIFFFYF